MGQNPRKSNDEWLKANQHFLDLDAARKSDDEDELGDLDHILDDFENFADDFKPSQAEIDSEDQAMLRRQKQFRLAADAVAAAVSSLSQVEKIVLFGSVANPLGREVPRFRKFRRAEIETWHECKDVDLAVWVSSLDHLKSLQKARSQAVDGLLADRGIGVAHHQIDVFLMEPGTDRYLGRLCIFGQCPKGKMDCLIEGCGAKPFLKLHNGFVFDWPSACQGSVTLYDRNHDQPTR